MSLVKKYKAEITSITNPIDSIYTVELKSQTGKFRYLPGQFLHLALDEYDPSNGWPESRCFSVQSSPLQELIKITFSVKGDFTKRMAEELFIGKIIDLKLPYGELFQREHCNENVVFIAGGTGVTPFLSILNDTSFKAFINPILYLGVRNLKYNIYKPELDLAQKINPSLKIKVIYQDQNGILNITNIYRETENASTYYISGPETMISQFKSKLIDLGFNEKNIKTDEWQ